MLANPRRGAIWYELGEVLGRAGRWREAAEAFNRVLAIEPGDPGAEIGLAQASARRGHYAEALSLYDRVLTQSPSNYDALQGKALVLYWTHHFRESQPIFERLERVNPADPENVKALGSLARAMDEERWAAMRPTAGAPPQAWMGYYISYLADHPDDAAAFKGLARAEGQLGLYDRAVRDDQRALRLDSADSSTQEHLAHVLSWNHQYAASVEAWNELLRKEPANREALESLARVDEWSGRLKAALGVEKRLLAGEPAVASDQATVVRLELALKDDGEARQTLAALLHHHPQDPGALLEMALLESRQGHLIDALSYYDSVLAGDFNDADALYGEARIYYFLGNPGRAYSLAARALAWRPKDFDALLLCARIERARQRPKDALMLIRRAEILNPTSPEIKALEAHIENDRKVTVHTSSAYARELGFRTLGPAPAGVQAVEDLNAYSSAIRTGFSVLPHSDSYVLLAATPSNSPFGGIHGAVAPAELIYGQTTRLSNRVTLRGGFGAVRLGPGVLPAAGSSAGSPATVTTRSIAPIGYFGYSLSPARGLSVDLSISRAPITATPASVRLGVMETRLSAGISYALDAHTRVAGSYDHVVDSSPVYYETYLPFPTAFFRNGRDSGDVGSLVLDRNLIRTDRFSLDTGYRGLAFGYTGRRHAVYMGFFNPILYQSHFVTAHAAGVIAGPLRLSFDADVGVQQAEEGGPFTRASEVHPALSVRVSRSMTLTLGYLHYDFSQYLGAVRGNAVELETDWRF